MVLKKILVLIEQDILDIPTLQERLSCAFVMATFDFVVQLAFKGRGALMLTHNTQHLSARSMLESAEFYDLPAFWVINPPNGFKCDEAFNEIMIKQMSDICLNEFDIILNW